MVSESPEAQASPNPSTGNVPVFTVGELSGALKRTIEQAYGHVRLRGEISGCKPHSSGHIYLALKDADALIDAVCWRGTASKLSIRPADGMEVIATGRLTTYPGRSKYQFIIEQMELAGEGALLKMLEDRKRKLAAEGLFEQVRKKPLPYLPTVIGIVTSPTGAVIRDILHRLDERFPRHVLLWPVAVQGDGAAAQVVAAIEGFNRIAPGGPIPRPDILIVARGGGSLEDLMAFNEEAVVRAAAASRIPLISAVGHETDTTLIDFASDRRAPTPTAAAEMAVPVRLDLMAQIERLGGRMNAAASRLLDERRLRVEGLARGLPEPQRLLEIAMQRLDDRTERLDLAWRAGLRDRSARIANVAARLKHPRQQLADHARHLETVSLRLAPAAQRLTERGQERLASITPRLDAAIPREVDRHGKNLARLGQLLDSLSPYKVLERGYAVVEDREGRPMSAATIEPGAALNLRFHDATVPVRAEGGDAAEAPVQAKPEPAKPKPKPAETRQPSLF